MTVFRLPEVRGSFLVRTRKARFVSRTLAAQAQAYDRVRNIMISDMYYRTDIGERWFEDHDRLHTWGFLREV